MATAPYMAAPKQTVKPAVQPQPPTGKFPGYSAQQQSALNKQQAANAPQIARNNQMQNSPAVQQEIQRRQFVFDQQQRQQGNTMQANNGGYGYDSGGNALNAAGESNRMMKMPQQQSYGGQPGGQGGAVTPGQAPQFNPYQGGSMGGNMGYMPTPNKPMGSNSMWNPTMPGSQQPQSGQQAQHGAAIGNFFKGSPNIWNEDAFKSNDSPAANYISSVLPVAQLDQNAYQYGLDFNESKRRWDAEQGLARDQFGYQTQLSTRQQQMAEQQAHQAAGQWSQQFGHTQNMDMLGYGLSKDQIGNQFTQGMDQNQASRDVAGMYAGSQKYQADQQLAGNQFMSNNQLKGDMYQADQGLAQAGLYSGAQRYGADQSLQGYKYQADRGLDEAGLYSGAQRYGTDAQERMNAAQMANNMSVAAMQTYGRSQAPNLRAARSWA